MKKQSWYLALFLPLLIVACAKDNLNDEEVQNQTTTDRAPQCSPRQVTYEFTDYWEDLGYGWWLPCLEEYVTIDDLEITESGRFIVSASCNINNFGVWDVVLHATGDSSGDSYTLTETDDFHSIYGSWDSQHQRATIYRTSYNTTVVNETTGQRWDNATTRFKMVLNANGELVNFEFDDFDCGD